MSRKKTNPESSAHGPASAPASADPKTLVRANPFQRRMAALRQAMLEAVTPQDVQDIIRQVVVKARLGDLTAAKLALGYVVGKPGKSVEPDRVELDEWKLLSERPKVDDVNEVIQKSFTAPLSNVSVLGNDLVVTKEMLRRLGLEPAANGGLTAPPVEPSRVSGRMAADAKAPPPDHGVLTGQGAAADANKNGANGAPPRLLSESELSLLERLLACPESGHDIDRILAEDMKRNGNRRKR